MEFFTPDEVFRIADPQTDSKISTTRVESEEERIGTECGFHEGNVQIVAGIRPSR